MAYTQTDGLAGDRRPATPLGLGLVRPAAQKSIALTRGEP